jgi:hypothetical protein
VDSGTVRFSATLLPDVGRAVAGILAQPEVTKNQHLYIASLVVNQISILSALQDLTVSMTWQVQKTTSTDQETLGTSLAAAGNDKDALRPLFLAGVYADSARQDLSERYELSNLLLGLPEPRSDGIKAARWAIRQSSCNCEIYLTSIEVGNTKY